jgi:tRNA G18 (ribose-2'-O)-methylase SpoU
MKNRFQITEQEKKEILEQHNLFKEVLKSKSKVKRLMVNEQATPTSGGGVEFLKAARDKGCQVAKGGVLRSAPGKPTVLYKKADFKDRKSVV